VRIGWGRFADWIPSSLYEQTLTVDGSHQRDILIANPGYPTAAPAPGATPPSDRYLLAPDLGLPHSEAAGGGVEHQLAPGLRLYATYTWRAGRRLLRGENINPVIDGDRLRPEAGNVVMTRGDAASWAHTVMVQAITTGGGRLSATGAYVLSRSRSNTAGDAALPATALKDEWGAVTPTHAATGTMTVRVARSLTVALAPRWRSGSPFTITTGHDDNGDGIFTDRPPGLGRNSGRTPAQFEVSGRIAYVWRLGRAAAGDARGVDGDGASALRTGAPRVATGHRYRVEGFANVQNLTNRPNYSMVGSVLTSPLFGRPVAGAGARRVDVGVRFAF
jgi:hypothetical protein